MAFSLRHNEPKLPQKEAESSHQAYAWHSVELVEVWKKIGSSEEGLSQKEVTTRRKQFGVNKLTEAKTPGIFHRIAVQLKNPLVLVLIGACILTLGLEEYLDAIVIAFAFLIAVGVGVLQEGRASKAFEKLTSSQVHMAIVIRDGKRHEVPAEELVPGDVVELQNGMYVPADIRLVSTKKLSVNEASLTGEWQAVEKSSEIFPVGTPFAEQFNMAWLVTFVAEGHGLGVVVATADDTEMGSLARELQFIDEAKTPLQVEMQKVSVFMLYVIVSLIALILVIGVWQEQPFTEMILVAVAIAVASVPEGLPAAVTIILAVGMESLLKRGGLVRNLLAAETLGSTTYVLTDKTGTLTEARLALTGVVTAETENLDPDSWGEYSDSNFAIETATYAIDAYEDDGVLRGDPVEKAILRASLSTGTVQSGAKPAEDRIDYLAFTSQNRFAAGLAPLGDGARLCINGAPEYLLESASHYYVNGQSHKLSKETKEEFIASLSEYTSEGKRLIAVAYKDVKYDDIPDEKNGEKAEGENNGVDTLLDTDEADEIH